jgi:hypothetical protein
MSQFTRKMILCACLTLSLLGVSGVANAHSDEWLEHHAPHGGQLQDCGPYHIELTNQGNKLFAYVYHSDSFKKISTRGWNAEAVTYANSKHTQTQMEPVGGNALMGAATGLSDAKRKVVFVAYPLGQAACSARYTPGTVAALVSAP